MSYKTYQEAKVAMPLACIIHDTDNARFFGMPSREGTTLTGDGCKFAEAKDHCMSMLTFSELGHKLVDGDLYQNEEGRVFTVGRLGYEAKYCNLLSSYCFPSKISILRTSALENQMKIDNLATQTPEEKEVLDSIAAKSVHLRDYQKADKPRTKVEYEKVTESIFDLREEFERGELHYDFGDDDWFTFNDEASLVAGFKEGNVYRRIEITESPQQREERERLEAAYDLYFEWMLDGNTSTEQIKTLEDFLDDKEDVNDWLRVVDKTNYRKESN